VRLLVVDRKQDFLARAEVEIDRALRQAGALRQVADREGGGGILAQQPLRRADDGVAALALVLGGDCPA